MTEINRRDLLLGVAVGGGVAPVIATVRDKILDGIGELITEIPETAFRYEERSRTVQRLLRRYLWPGLPDDNRKFTAALVPAMQDSWGPKNRQFSGSGRTVAHAYVSAFGPWQHLRNEPPDLVPDDAPILIGSHLANAHAARYFGDDPTSRVPIHRVIHVDDACVHGEKIGFEAELRWALHTPKPENKLVRMELFQGSLDRREEPNHTISDREGGKPCTPDFFQQGETWRQIDDYLIITVLPRDSREDRRVVSLAGNQKMGTLAAAILLRDANIAEKVLSQIDASRGLRSAKYFQALIRVQVEYDGESPRPSNLELVGAEPINIKPVYSDLTSP